MQISPAQLSQLTQSINSIELNSLSGTDSSTDDSSSFENILEQMLTDMATQSSTSTPTSSTVKSTGAVNPATSAQSSSANGLNSTQLQAQNAMQMLEALNSQSLMQNSMISSDASTDSSDSSGII